MQYLGADFHYQNLMRGVIDTRDVLYYASVTGFAFLLTDLYACQAAGIKLLKP